MSRRKLFKLSHRIVFEIAFWSYCVIEAASFILEKVKHLIALF